MLDRKNFVLAGEDSISGAIREVSEELGIQLSPAHLRRFDRLKMENRIEDLWLAEVSRNVIGVPALGAEVSDWKWSSRAELEQSFHRMILSIFSRSMSWEHISVRNLLHKALSKQIISYRQYKARLCSSVMKIVQ